MVVNQSDKEEFIDILTSTMNTYGRELSTGVVKVWWSALSPYQLKAVRDALSRHVQDVDIGQYPPKPSDILRRLQGGTTSDRAFVAWSVVERAIRHVGGMESVVFDDPLIHAVIDQMGGWIRLCETIEKELPFRAQEFQKRYRGAWHNPPATFPAKLIGKVEHHNSEKGFEAWIEPPTLIGEEEGCRTVLEQGSRSRSLQIRKADDSLRELSYDGGEG